MAYRSTTIPLYYYIKIIRCTNYIIQVYTAHHVPIIVRCTSLRTWSSVIHCMSIYIETYFPTKQWELLIYILLNQIKLTSIIAPINIFTFSSCNLAIFGSFSIFELRSHQSLSYCSSFFILCIIIHYLHRIFFFFKLTFHIINYWFSS